MEWIYNISWEIKIISADTLYQLTKEVIQNNTQESTYTTEIESEIYDIYELFEGNFTLPFKLID